MSIQTGLIVGPNPESIDGISASNDALVNIFGGGAVTEFSFGHPVTMTGNISFNTCPLMTSLEFRLLVNCEGSLTVSDAVLLTTFAAPLLNNIATLDLSGSTTLTSLDISSLVTAEEIILVGTGLTAIELAALVTVDNFMTTDSAALTSISLPALVTCEQMQCYSTPTLTSFSAPSWLPTDGGTINLSGCALDEASVNHILSRCVDADLADASIQLEGGTNAAPTGQGLADKATLISNGNSVDTN